MTIGPNIHMDTTREPSILLSGLGLDANFYGVGLEGPGLGRCIGNFLASPSNARKIIKLTIVITN